MCFNPPDRRNGTGRIFFGNMVNKAKDEFYKGIQKEAEKTGRTLLSVCDSRGMSYNTFLHWKHRHPASFGKRPPDKGPEEPTEVIRLRPEEEAANQSTIRKSRGK